jgi:hypothetical protein
MDLLEEEQRQKTGEDKGAILVTYSCPPEDTVLDYLKENLPLLGLDEREIDVPIIQGHPMFQEGISEKGVDSLLPKIGVEWARDTRTESLGLNEHTFRPGKNFYEMLNEYSQRPDSRRLPSQSFIDRFSKAKVIQQFQWMVQSEVVITGFTTGVTGRKVCQWLYEAVDGLLAPMQNDLSTIPGISILLPEQSEPNISVSDFAKPVFGFEIMVKIVQTRNVWRIKPDFIFPLSKKFEVHLKGSKSRFEGSFGLETYGRP